MRRWIWIGCLLAAAGLEAQAQLWIYQDTLAGGWSDWSWSCTRDFSRSTPVYTGSYSLAVQTAAWGGLSLYHAALPRTEYGALEFYIRGASNNISLWLYFENTDTGQSSDLVLLNDAALIAGGTIDTGTWKKALIRLDTVPSMPSSFSRITWFNNASTAQARYYLDQVRLTSVGELPPTLRRVRAQSATEAMVFFDQSMDTGSLSRGVFFLRNTSDVHYATAVQGVYQRYTTQHNGAVVSYPHAFQTAGVYRLTASGVSNVLGMAMQGGVTGRFSLATATLHINATADLHRISPFVYGLAFGPDTNYLRGAGITVNRSGGNRKSI